MKKNFLKIAAMLIAAMLLAVSCSQEVAPKNDGLVSASVNIADTRSLSTSGEELGNISYQYQLKALFTKAGDNSDIVGNTGESENDWQNISLTNSKGTVGYVTQGLWKIKVRGVKNGVVVISGEAEHYFNNQNEIAKIFVNPTAGNGTVTISDIKMQDLDEYGSTKYKVKYSLTAIDANSTAEAVVMTRSNGSNYVSSYSAATVEKSAGYYRLTISVWGPEIKVDGSVDSSGKEVLLGGVTKGIRVLNGSAITVTGSIEPKDFDQSDIKVLMIVPTGTLTVPESPVTNQKIELSVTETTGEISSLLGGLTKKSGTDKSILSGNDYIKYYIWGVDGTEITDTTGKHEVNYNVPGPKTVSCTIVYQVKMFGTVYTFASTESGVASINFIVNESSASSGQ